ncbi:hypothetical protein SLW70_07850 [Flavobacterium sp. NG2]|nr:hypothetical protein [Flavobacterium sp. NG2]WPR73021.1 hypothetical protein SLW70_07850 [Flavobacterium sp. NG2]
MLSVATLFVDLVLEMMVSLILKIHSVSLAFIADRPNSRTSKVMKRVCMI